MRLNAILFIFLSITSSFVFSQTEEENSEEKNSILSDKFHVKIGGFYPSKILKISVDGSTSNNEIEFGKNLGFKNSELTLLMGFDWNFSKRWKLAFEYFGVKSTSKRVIDEDIEWEDVIYKAGVSIKDGFGVDIYRVYVGRSFVSSQKHQFGGGIGVHATKVSAFIEGEAYIDENATSFERSSKSVMLPLPNIGVWYYFAPTKKLAFIANVDFFAISIDEYSGVLWDLKAGVNYQFLKHFGASVNYNYINIGAKFNSSGWDGDIDLTFIGPSLSITANF